MTSFLHDIEQCLNVLEQGGVILYPTDTVWGLGCDATNAAAVEKIYRIKHRPDTKSMIVLLADERELLRYVVAPDPQVFYYLEQVKKPTTVVYEGVVGLADNVINADGSAGIRLVRDEFCKHLIRRFRKPIVSTSANLSGRPTPHFFSEIEDAIKKAADYTAQWRQNDKTLHAPSAVVKWKQGTITVIRP